MDVAQAVDSLYVGIDGDGAPNNEIENGVVVVLAVEEHRRVEYNNAAVRVRAW